MEWWKGWIWLALVVVGGMTLKDPILTLELSVSENDKMITTFAIGSSEVNGSISYKLSVYRHRLPRPRYLL